MTPAATAGQTADGMFPQAGRGGEMPGCLHTRHRQ